MYVVLIERYNWKKILLLYWKLKVIFILKQFFLS